MKKIKNLKKFFFCAVAFIYLNSCQVNSKRSDPNSSEKIVGSEKTYDQPPRQEIDYQSIQRLLNLDKKITQLGYDERAFNTCKVGFGYSSNENCFNKYFVVIHFKLMCRNSEGTISSQLLEDELIPVANEALRWTLKNTSGELRTDSYGHGQVVLVSPQSQRTERFRVSSSNDFLLMRAGDIKRLVVPSNWCE